MSRQRIMLVDDHEVVRLGLKALIERQANMEVVAEASTAAEAVAKSLAFKETLSHRWQQEEGRVDPLR